MSGFDSDRTYPLDLNTLPSELTNRNKYKYEFKKVVQPPTDPCYKKACELKLNRQLAAEQCQDVEEETGFSDDDYDLDGDFKDLCLLESPSDRVGQPNIIKLLENYSGAIFMPDEDELEESFVDKELMLKNELAINLDDYPSDEEEFLAKVLSDVCIESKDIENEKINKNQESNKSVT